MTSYGTPTSLPNRPEPPVTVRRPALDTALRRVWRDAHTLQIGLDPERALVLGGVDSATARLLDALDGTRELEALLAHADTLGVAPARARALLEMLNAGGVLRDAADGATALRALDQVERDRLAPDLAAASLVHGRPGEALTRRRNAHIEVLGLGRTGATLALLLAGSGVGRVVPVDEQLLEPADLAPGGPTREQLGVRRQEAAREALARHAPATRTTRPRRRRPPDVVAVVTTEHPPPLPPVLDDLQREGIPHLLVAVREVTAAVGPFVIPGRTACARCVDLRRRDRDPGWPALAAQLATAVGPPAESVLAVAAAAQAALQVLRWVDTESLPPAADGTIEVHGADGRMRRRTWVPHPACGCAPACSA